MPRVCTICFNPRHEEINFAILEHQKTYAVIAKEFGVSEDSIKRHVRNHLKPMVQQVDTERKEKDKAVAARTLEVLDAIIAKLPELLSTATLSQILRAVELRARITGEDTIPPLITFVWGKGLEAEDDDMQMKATELKDFEVIEAVDRGENAESRQPEPEPEQ